MNWFEAARERAHERFDSPGEFPLIDDQEIVEEDAVYGHWPWFGGNQQDVDELRQTALTVDHLDPSVRCVYLNLFYRLAHYPVEQVASVVEDVDHAATHREQFEHYLEGLVRLVDVEQCSDARQIRWEIVNACAIRDWDRAKRLYVRLEELAGEDLVCAMRGRFEFLAVFAGGWELEDLGLYLWAPITDGRWSLLNEILCAASVQDDPPVALSADARNRLEDAAHHLARSLRDKPDLDIVYAFLLLRCRLALEEFRDAAADCEALLERRDEFAEQPKDTMISRLYALAVRSYASDGQIERGLAVSSRWKSEFPNEPGIHECRSRLFQAQCDFESAFEELQEEVDKNPVRGKDPAVGIAFAFGRLYQSPERQFENFRKQIPIREAERIGTVVRIHWPQVEKLAPGNIKEWVASCYLLLHRVPDSPAMAMGTFARLVENELRHRVFRRFREDFRGDRTSPGTLVDEDPLSKYLRGDDRFALGQMLNEIRFPKARTEVGQRFRRWIEERGLLTALRRIDLDRFYKLHIPGKHADENYTPSWADAEDLARLSRDLLSVVLEC